MKTLVVVTKRYARPCFFFFIIQLNSKKPVGLDFINKKNYSALELALNENGFRKLSLERNVFENQFGVSKQRFLKTQPRAGRLIYEALHPTKRKKKKKTGWFCFG